jgi:hypothetical protein
MLITHGLNHAHVVLKAYYGMIKKWSFYGWHGLLQIYFLDFSQWECYLYTYVSSVNV